MLIGGPKEMSKPTLPSTENDHIGNVMYNMHLNKKYNYIYNYVCHRRHTFSHCYWKVI